MVGLVGVVGHAIGCLTFLLSLDTNASLQLKGIIMELQLKGIKWSLDN